uniref:Uncharacterized protein n=1 Tax=Ditylenchus dipsaci TaxID=166011 RepID=A0A915D3V2_9BILA
MESPAIVDGEQISFEEVSKLMTKDLVSNSVAIDSNAHFCSHISLEKFHEGIAKLLEKSSEAVITKLEEVQPDKTEGTESAFLLQKAEFNQNWKGWADQLESGNYLMETMLLTQYMSQCEGPLWNSKRGKGLAYACVTDCLLNTIQGLSQPITLKICSQIWHADINDVLEKASKPLLSLFDEARTVRSVVVNSYKVNDLMKAFPGTELVKLEDLQLNTSK